MKWISVLRRKPKKEHKLGNITKLSAALRQIVILRAQPLRAGASKDASQCSTAGIWRVQKA